MIPKKLEEKRDELAELHHDKTNTRLGHYKKGFNSACNLLLPEIKKMEETLAKINKSAKTLAVDYDEDDEYAVGLDPVVIYESTNQALQSMRNYVGEMKDEA